MILRKLFNLQPKPDIYAEMHELMQKMIADVRDMQGWLQ